MDWGRSVPGADFGADAAISSAGTDLGLSRRLTFPSFTAGAAANQKQAHSGSPDAAPQSLRQCEAMFSSGHAGNVQSGSASAPGSDGGSALASGSAPAASGPPGGEAAEDTAAAGRKRRGAAAKGTCQVRAGCSGSSIKSLFHDLQPGFAAMENNVAAQVPGCANSTLGLKTFYQRCTTVGARGLCLVCRPFEPPVGPTGIRAPWANTVPRQAPTAACLPAFPAGAATAFARSTPLPARW